MVPSSDSWSVALRLSATQTRDCAQRLLIPAPKSAGRFAVVRERPSDSPWRRGSLWAQSRSGIGVAEVDKVNDQRPFPLRKGPIQARFARDHSPVPQAHRSSHGVFSLPQTPAQLSSIQPPAEKSTIGTCGGTGRHGHTQIEDPVREAPVLEEGR